MPDSRNRPRTWRTFFATHGHGPWTCHFCGGPILEIGSHSNGGNVHHLDDDKTNDEPANLAIAHHSCHSKHHTLENRDKIAARVKQDWENGVHFFRPQSAEVHKRQADSLRGRKLSPEALAKRSKTIKGRPLSEAHKAAIKAGWATRKAKIEALKQQNKGE